MKQSFSSRRDFLKSSGLGLAGLFVLPTNLSTSSKRSASLRYGLFCDEAGLASMRKNFATNPLFVSFRERLESLDRDQERQFIHNEVRYNDHLYDIARLHNTAPAMAFYYLMTGDTDAAALAAESIRTILKFPKWDYFLEAGEKVVGIQRASGCIVAVALTSDWLGDYISDSERENWLKVMAEKGCEASYLSIYGMRYKDRVVGWSMDETSTYFEHRPGDRIDLSNWPTILDRTNLKAVPAGALAIGAMTHRLHFGKTADNERWIEQAIYSISTFEGLYAQDGSYDEGVSYANYTSLHLIHGIQLFRKFGIADLLDKINWVGFSEYALNMTSPIYDDPFEIVNFGDNGNPKSGHAGTTVRSGVPMWVAKTYRDPQAKWFAENLAGDFDEWGLIWYDENLRKEKPTNEPKLWHSDLGWMVMRTGYEMEDLVVAMRSGGPSNHEHADRNGIMVKCYGESLIVDPYRPPYSFSDPSWMLRTTAGHSSVLVDGAGHQYHDGSEGTNASDAVAKVIRTGERKGLIYLTSDATPAYQLVNTDIDSITRTLLILHEIPAVVVLDKLIKRTEPSVLSARFFAYNNDNKGRILPETNSNGFKVERPYANLTAKAMIDGENATLIRAGKLPIPEERAVQHPFVDVVSPRKKLSTLLVTVLRPEQKVQPDNEIRISQESEKVIKVELQTGRKSVVCSIFDTGTIPEFEIWKK